MSKDSGVGKKLHLIGEDVTCKVTFGKLEKREERMKIVLNTRKTLAVAAAVALGLIVLPSTAVQGATKGSGTYVFLPKSLDNPYWVDAKAGMVAQAKKMGVKAQFLGPQNEDAAAQVKIFEQVLAKRPSGIAISPTNADTVIQLVAMADKAGVPIIAWDGPVPKSKVWGYIGTDNFNAGKSLGEAIAAGINKKGDVAVVTDSLSAPNLMLRLNGVKEALAKYPDIKIVQTVDAGGSVAKATDLAQTVLQGNPTLAAFIGIGGSDIPGIAAALKAANACAKTLSFGFDVVPQGIQGMKDGCVAGLVSQKPFGMTADALKVLVGYANGKKKPAKPFNIDTGVDLVTPTNLTAFLAAAPH